ncbi:hypothetical protein [Treponema porcinum]|uniref:hypothetical protein n=1 Tax=Treponema porcinum TaxID=261392 RepID=UPI002357F385|nr:hypothetical protein [Treponema porcinum]MCI7080949.1 hypothetical protein [Treponema porcinum]
MTKEELQFLIDTKKEYEFSYNGKKYNITYGTDEFHRTIYSSASCIRERAGIR